MASIIDEFTEWMSIKCDSNGTFKENPLVRCVDIGYGIDIKCGNVGLTMSTNSKDTRKYIIAFAEYKIKQFDVDNDDRSSWCSIYECFQDY